MASSPIKPVGFDRIAVLSLLGLLRQEGLEERLERVMTQASLRERSVLYDLWRVIGRIRRELG